MSILQHKIDFMALVSVTMANGNGDPLSDNRPRSGNDSKGILSSFCIKRKIRNRMQDLGKQIFVQSDDRADDGFRNLCQRADTLLDGIKDRDEYFRKACETWLDVRSFGQVFAFKDKSGDACRVRGPVSIHHALSVSPVEAESMKITKSVNAANKTNGKASDTLGWHHYVRFGLYKVQGSICVQLAEKTGFTDEDAQVLKECLRTLFVNDASAARPDGSMRVVKLFWWEHNCKDGQYPSWKVHESIDPVLKPGVVSPSQVEDYDICVTPLEGLAMEEIEGL